MMSYQPRTTGRTYGAGSLNYGRAGTTYSDSFLKSKPPVASTTTSSKYGSTASKYGATTSKYNTTPPRYRSPSLSRENSYSNTGGGSYTSSHLRNDSPRPLPKGPGPLDSNGRRISEFSNTLSSSRHADTTRRTAPVKVPHSHSTYTSTHRINSPISSPSSRTLYDYPSSTTPRDTTRLGHRTNSVSDLTNGLSNISVRDTKRKFETANTINVNSSPSGTPEKLYGKDRGIDRDTVSKSDRYARDRQEATDVFFNNDRKKSEERLPDISINNHTSRSPSPTRPVLERSKGSLDSEISPTKRKAPTRRNSYTEYKSDRSHVSPDTNNNKGLVGLRNLGNTCFMNSVVQCLSNTRPLLEYLMAENHLNNINTTSSSMRGQLIKAYAAVMRALWSGDSLSSHSPSEFKSQIGRFAKRFVGYGQQDAQEFLIYLLEGMHEDLNRVREKKKRNYPDDDDVNDTRTPGQKASDSWKHYLEVDNSTMVDIFVGQLKSSLTCTKCGYVSTTFDPFWDLSLPLKKKMGGEVSLRECFELFTHEEVLDGDEKPTCAKCKERRKCTKGFTIQKFPKILILHLKRFNQESMYRSKLSTMVNFPLEDLDLSRFSAEKHGAAPVYRLFAVSNHSGTPFGGHYTAYAKNPYSGAWHHFNDTRVSSISESRIKSAEAYVLFYELDNASSISRL